MLVEECSASSSVEFERDAAVEGVAIFLDLIDIAWCVAERCGIDHIETALVALAIGAITISAVKTLRVTMTRFPCVFGAGGHGARASVAMESGDVVSSTIYAIIGVVRADGHGYAFRTHTIGRHIQSGGIYKIVLGLEIRLVSPE